MQNPNGFRANINPPHRKFSDSELREFSFLVRDYVDLNHKASDSELQEGILNLGELFDYALQLRYQKPKS